MEGLELTMFGNSFKGRKVLITGNTGFKGSWLSAWLVMLGAEVCGFSLGVPSEPANFNVQKLEEVITHNQGDIRDRKSFSDLLEKWRPEIIFHLAAQALVRKSYSEPALTFETNTFGTMNVLECLRNAPWVKAAVIITSDKCYRNQEWEWGYRENDLLGGEDPYSSSKGCAELIAYSYFHSFFKSTGKPLIATTRAGNVIGGGDWALDRIVPDCVRAWSKGEPVKVRQPNATRPWQHVLEPLSGYLWLGAKLLNGAPSINGEGFNFGPQATVNQSVGELLEAMAERWPGAKVELNADGCGKKHESNLLKLCCDKALNLLDWHAVLNFQETVDFTVEWYRSFYQEKSANMRDQSFHQIEKYVSKAKNGGLEWSR